MLYYDLQLVCIRPATSVTFPKSISTRRFFYYKNRIDRIYRFSNSSRGCGFVKTRGFAFRQAILSTSWHSKMR